MTVNDFIAQNVGLVYRVLGQFRRSNPALFNVIGDDLESAGLWAMKCVYDKLVDGGYDPRRAKISTYATMAIRNWCLKSIAVHERTRLNESTETEWDGIQFDRGRQVDILEAMGKEAEREITQRRIRRRERRMDEEDAARGQRRLFADAEAA